MHITLSILYATQLQISLKFCFNLTQYFCCLLNLFQQFLTNPNPFFLISFEQHNLYKSPLFEYTFMYRIFEWVILNLCFSYFYKSPLFEYTFMYRIFEWVILSCIDYCKSNVHKFKINYISTIALVCEEFIAKRVDFTSNYTPEFEGLRTVSPADSPGGIGYE